MNATAHAKAARWLSRQYEKAVEAAIAEWDAAATSAPTLRAERLGEAEHLCGQLAVHTSLAGKRLATSDRRRFNTALERWGILRVAWSEFLFKWAQRSFAFGYPRRPLFEELEAARKARNR